MSFTRKNADLTPIVDTVFVVADAARKDKKENPDLVKNATLGSLYDEEGNLVAFDSVFNHYDEIDHKVKAKYASSFTGNPNYREEIYKWFIQDIDLDLAHSTIATPGGTGAVSLTLKSILDTNETLIVPNIAWGSYNLMASENKYNLISYEMFEGDHFNLSSLKKCIEEVKETQEKIVIIINDPCHNPTGYSLTIQEWEELVSYLNEVSKNNPCIIINDVAYIDYSYDLANSRNYLNTWNSFSENILSVVAFSLSKTMTSYGMRCGAAIVLAKKQEDVRDVEILMEKGARATWSNINNSAMENFVWVAKENKENYLKEKDTYIKLLRERSTIFMEEAKECGLDIYPYKEGFFLTVKMNNNEDRDRLHEALINKHIYTVKVNLGIRVAICSLSIEATKGLAKLIKDTMMEIL